VETIEGRHSEIKDYTIATRVFGRDDDFDQATDPLVSIQANQLRRALERYYLVAGKQDPVRIDIPKGTYVPVFDQQTGIDEDLAAGGKVSDMTFEDSWPSVQILPFKNLTGDPEKDFMGMGFATELAVEVASFQEIKVSFPGEEQKAEADCKARFVMNGYIYGDSTGIKVTVHLTDTKTGKQIWGETIRADVGAKNLLTFQGKVAREIAAKTTGEYGVIPKAIVAESKNKPLQALNTYEAMLQYQEFDQNPSPENFMRAMEALKAAANTDPDCGFVWGLLARLHALI
jgi:TolB-like protein